jgi:hypothetical protein
MKTLPRLIVALDESLREAGRYELVPARTGVRQGLREHDYDNLILRHCNVLASVLREGELLEADSELKPLADRLPA